MLDRRHRQWAIINPAMDQLALFSAMVPCSGWLPGKHDSIVLIVGQRRIRLTSIKTPLAISTEKSFFAGL